MTMETSSWGANLISGALRRVAVGSPWHPLVTFQGCRFPAYALGMSQFQVEKGTRSPKESRRLLQGPQGGIQFISGVRAHLIHAQMSAQLCKII